MKWVLHISTMFGQESYSDYGEKLAPEYADDMHHGNTVLFRTEIKDNPVELVGIADVFIIGFVGEAAVSGVSLVNSFNTIFIYLFTALASGGAVVVSQYIGRKEKENGSHAASQLLAASVLFSVVISAVVLAWNEQILQFLFGRVEADVMAACVTYLRISAYSYPALAVYNAGSAMYRSFGKTKTTMNISIIADAINIIGNCIGVFVLKAGVAGVAWPSLISRCFTALVITYLCFSKENPVHYIGNWILHLDRDLQKKTLRIAVPNGVERFQAVRRQRLK
ncbi:MAG: MATE family efflux transporter [Lachnospiraceae bacterium]|nr:MATE family efflux transporter [Lachnospiraceae bacterium]